MDSLKNIFNKNIKEEENSLRSRFIQNVSLQHNLSILNELQREYNSFNEDLNYNEIVSQFMDANIRCLNIINEKLKKLEK